MTNGVIAAEEGKSADTEVVVVRGERFDRGYLSPHFITSAKSLITLPGQISRKKEPLPIIAGDVEGDDRATLVMNELNGTSTPAPPTVERREAIETTPFALTSFSAGKSHSALFFITPGASRGGPSPSSA